MRNACPTCQTVYAVTPADVGRRITCTRCNANLVIDEDGFRLADGTGGSKSVPPPPPRTDPEPAERKRSSRRARVDDDEPKREPAKDEPKPRRRRDKDDEDQDEDDDDTPKPSVNAGELFQKYLDIPTVVFAVGVVVVLWFLFAPLLGSADQRWHAARIEDEQLTHEAEVKKLKDEGKADVVTKREEEWRKRKEELERRQARVGIGNRQAEYWNRFGLLGGFVVTALGAVGLLMSHQTRVKRVVGAVVVIALLLIVFLSFLGKVSVSAGVG